MENNDYDLVTLVVLAGGKSSRMGRDKALLPFLGKPLIERIVSRLCLIAGEVILSTDNPDLYSKYDWKIVVDEVMDSGPLAGFCASFKAASFPMIAVVACDMPFVNEMLFNKLIQDCHRKKADAAIPASPRGLEPMHAVFFKEPCLPVIQESFQNGELEIINWVNKINLLVLGKDQVSKFDPNYSMFINVNTQEEFSRAEQYPYI
jgi:molybdenum cofactor guanylyltransferase